MEILGPTLYPLVRYEHIQSNDNDLHEVQTNPSLGSSRGTIGYVENGSEIAAGGIVAPPLVKELSLFYADTC